MSKQTVAILAKLLEEPQEPLFGLEISKAVGLKTGTVYPALARLEAAGWLESEWESGTATERERPLRRLYRLTGVGELSATRAIDQFFESKAQQPPIVGRRGLLGDPEPGAA